MVYAAQFAAFLQESRDERQAVSMAAYMKDHFPFLGIPTPVRTDLTRRFWKEYGMPSEGETRTAVRELWALPEREFQYAALVLIDRKPNIWQEEDVRLFEEMIVTKSWWDTVDMLASHAMGSLLARYPSLAAPCADAWMSSGQLWLQRTALLFQLGYKEKTDSALLFRMIRACSGSKEFFLRKAIGWALREYSKTNPEAVLQFVRETDLSPLSVREALKVLHRKGLSEEKDLASEA